MGKAGSPYARSVPSIHPLNPAALPAPELVFDQLLKRDKFVEHPGGISSLFFAFADFIIHSIFNTDTRDWTKNDVSSYLDLSPLYGSSDADLDKVRRKDGTGRLWDDVFADWRLLNMPPSVGALIVLFNRNHNVGRSFFSASHISLFSDRSEYSSSLPSASLPSTRTATSPTHLLLMPKRSQSKRMSYSSARVSSTAASS